MSTHDWTDERTGEVVTGTAPCGRPWGTQLWPGGPILGGENWREFAVERMRRERSQPFTPRAAAAVRNFNEPRGEWE